MPRLIDRRRFCVGAAAGLVVLGAGCGDRALDGTGDDAGQDLRSNPVDLGADSMEPGAVDLASATQRIDLARANQCAGLVDCGVIAALAVGSSQHFSDGVHYDFVICRDLGGLYAMSSYCTHLSGGCPLTQASATPPYFFCPCHGATFAFDGSAPTSPASAPLVHYALCIDSNGHAQVDYLTIVAPSTRA